MSLLFLLSWFLVTSFESTVERVFTLVRNGEWAAAASTLDQAYTEDPALFAANNFGYLRGRIAVQQQDWKRAQQEFAAIAPGNALHALATWHAARAAIRLRDDVSAEALLGILPSDFLPELRVQLARDASPALALKIYQSLTTREARMEAAKRSSDHARLWTLMRERGDDDIAFSAAQILAPAISSDRERMDIAGVYLAHRQFEDALPLYQVASQNRDFAAEARYLMGRVHFLGEDYRRALETFQSVANDFPGTEWEMDADYQIASCFWRLGQYRDAERAYLSYIRRYGRRGSEEGAVRNLVDVYRVLGENQKALAWIDRMLARSLSIASRQVLQFTKAKILYTQKRYTAAANLFGRLAVSRLRTAPGGTTKEEAQYFQALSLSKAGNRAAAATIWKKLASQPMSFYGQKAAQKLQRASSVSNRQDTQTRPALCGKDDSFRAAVEDSLEQMRRPLRKEPDTASDALAELVFLRLWDEASLWNERPGQRPPARTAAELAYAGGRYHRSIAFADRLPKSDSSSLGLLYPAGFSDLVCGASGAYNADPLWLHAIIWQESKYNPNARSGASARGLMQFVPDTAAKVAAAIGIQEFSPDRLYDPAINVRMGAHYWASLLKELKDPAMALAAYNGGIDNVRRWQNKWPDAPSGDSELFVADIGFAETKRYVMAVFEARAAYGKLNP